MLSVSPASVDLGVRSATVALLLLLVAVLMRELGRTLQGRLAALFALGVAGYALCSSALYARLDETVRLPLFLLCTVNPVFFWWLALALFEDGFRLRPPHLLPAALVLASALAQHALPTDAPAAGAPGSAVLELGREALGLVLVVHALAVAFRGRAADLIDERRRFRLVFAAVAGGYTALVAVAELAIGHAPPGRMLALANIAAICAVTFFLATRLLTVRAGSLLREVGPPAAPAGDDPFDAVPLADRATLQRLLALVERERVYREPGLTIGGLASRLGVPEHRLRSIINKGLGYRNFASFLNRYRLEEAMEALADPERARLPVLTIALELGYGSVGPFNRAFKARVGETPTAYRRRMLAAHRFSCGA